MHSSRGPVTVFIYLVIRVMTRIVQSGDIGVDGIYQLWLAKCQASRDKVTIKTIANSHPQLLFRVVVYLLLLVDSYCEIVE